MTTIIEEKVTCAVCGSTQTVQEIGSTSSFGAMDLDTRPPPLRRSTMELWVHECGECGYVAPELGTAAEGAARIVASAAYRTELGAAVRVRLANRMVCRSMLDVAANDAVTAGWRRLHAAWACDDAEATEEARAQRLAALALLLGPSWTSPFGPAYGGSGNVPAFPVEQARARGLRAMKSVEGGDEVLLADIARRCAEFTRSFLDLARWARLRRLRKRPAFPVERALAYCDAGLAVSEVPAFVRTILEFERGLVLARDTACHSVAEAEEAPRGRAMH